MDDFVIISLLESEGFFDDLISWRLESNWVHGIIQVGSFVYSSTFPKTVKLPPTDPEVAMPPRSGTSWKLAVTSDQKNKILEYLDGRLGSDYDVISMLAWALRIRALQSKNKTYCFEMVYDALTSAGLVADRNKKLISGDQLESVILTLGAKQIISNAVGVKPIVKTMIKLKTSNSIKE